MVCGKANVVNGAFRDGREFYALRVEMRVIKQINLNKVEDIITSDDTAKNIYELAAKAKALKEWGKEKHGRTDIFLIPSCRVAMPINN